MKDLLFEYKVRYRYKTEYKEFSFYATTEIEEFLNRKNIEYVRNMTDTVEHRLLKEIERLNKIINEFEKYIKESCWKDDWGVESIYVKTLLNKLQELKGSDNGIWVNNLLEVIKENNIEFGSDK